MYFLILLFLLCDVFITVVEIESLKSIIKQRDLSSIYEKGDY